METPAIFDLPLQGVAAVRVELEDGGVVNASTAEFEPTEHGVLIGLRLFPWHRIRRYSWVLTPRDFTGDDGHVRARVRVAIHGQDEIVVPAERFETGAWTISAVIDDVVDVETGNVSRIRLFIPWHRVLEYERLPLTQEAPPRPDDT